MGDSNASIGEMNTKELKIAAGKLDVRIWRLEQRRDEILEELDRRTLKPAHPL